MVANWFSGSVVTFQVIAITKISSVLLSDALFLVRLHAVCHQLCYLAPCISSFLAMVMTNYTQLRILSLHWKGLKVSAIAECLVLEDHIRVSKQGIRMFFKHFATRKSIGRKPGSGHCAKVSTEIHQFIEHAMREDDETTATQLQAKLANAGVYISLATIVRSRVELGWIYRGSAYCQLIWNANKEKRLEFARAYLHNSFNNVIWSDETTVQLENQLNCCFVAPNDIIGLCLGWY